MELDSAFILHRYPYHETSFLLKIFTKSDGLIAVIARNAKRPKSDWYALLQPFQRLNIRYHGKGSVLTLTQAEREGSAVLLTQKSLFAGFYLNELLLKFLAPHDVHSKLFHAYHEAMQALHDNTEGLEKILRTFELRLFDEMGFLPDFVHDEAGNFLDEKACYQLEQHHQPRKIDKPEALLPYHFQGIELIRLREKNFSDASALKSAKRFTRLWLEFYGLGKNLHSREIFAEVFCE